MQLVAYERRTWRMESDRVRYRDIQGRQKVIPYWSFVTIFLPIVMKGLRLMVETFHLGICNDSFLTQTQSLMTMGKKIRYEIPIGNHFLTTLYIEAMVSVSQYNRGAGNASIIVCGGVDSNNSRIASCEELSIDAGGLPAASSWRSFASLPSTLRSGCMLHLNGKVRFDHMPFFK